MCELRIYNVICAFLSNLYGSVVVLLIGQTLKLRTAKGNTLVCDTVSVGIGLILQRIGTIVLGSIVKGGG